jgi:replicative DNA helicase
MNTVDFNTILADPTVNLELERHILAALLRAPGMLTDLDFISSWHFYCSQHQNLYGAMLDLKAEGKVPSTPVMVATLDLGSRDFMNGETLSCYLSGLETLYTAPPTLDVVKSMARTMQSLAEGRELVATAREYEKDLRSGLTAESAITKALQAADIIKQGLYSDAIKNTHATAANVAKLALQRYDELQASGGDLRKAGIVQTGLLEFDRRVVGLRGGNVIAVAARPGVGKTTFVGSILNSMARDSKVGTALIEMEMTDEEMGYRVLADTCQAIMSERYNRTQMLSYNAIMTGHVGPSDRRFLVEAAAELERVPFHMDFCQRLTIEGIYAKLRNIDAKLRAQHGVPLQCAAIDQLSEIVAGSRYAGRKVDEYREIMVGLKYIAKEMGIPIFILVQLRRNDMRRPVLQEIKESGGVEEVSDMIIMLYREWCHLEEKLRNKEEGQDDQLLHAQLAASLTHMDVIVAKQRMGQVFSQRVMIIPQTGSVRRIPTDRDPPPPTYTQLADQQRGAAITDRRVANDRVGLMSADEATDFADGP